jgi:SOS-response transcriptional repressor LexA
MSVTTKQLKVFNFIYSYMSEHQEAPSLGKIAGGTGLNSIYSAYRYVDVLCQQGYLSKLKGVPQSIEIVKVPPLGVSPTTGEPKTGTDLDARLRAAYARGVMQGRKDSAQADAIDAADQRGYRRGLADARAKLPATRLAAYDQGHADGRGEAKRDLTERRRYAE